MKEELEKLVNLWYATYEQLHNCETALSDCCSVIEDSEEGENAIPTSANEYEESRLHAQDYFEDKLNEMFPNYIFKLAGSEWILISEI